MNDNAKLWVAALRGDEFQQAKHYLRDALDNDCMCCLGVACELYRRETGEGEWDETLSDLGHPAFVVDGEANTMGLPSPVVGWLGLDSDEGVFIENGQAHTLTSRNDGGKTFPQIADIIESEPEGLFA